MERTLHRSIALWPLAGWLLLLLAPVAAGAAPNYKLKSGPISKICIECHDEFNEVLTRRVLHTPVAEGKCAGCHSPHASDYAKMLSAPRGEICQDCHHDLTPETVVSVHPPFAERKCDSCHDPHGTDNRMILFRAGSALCFECHEDLGKKVQSNRFAHKPVTESCLKCHEPHTSSTSTSLLKKPQPALCLECHKTGGAAFRQKHNNYPVEKGRCTSCHNPHGSDTASILYDNIHPPVAEKKCSECHAKPGAASPFALKDRGFEICQGCHYDTVNDAFNNAHMHWPLLDERGCINCHTPHASPDDSLLKGSLIEVCGSCHADTVARQSRSQTKHDPVAEGDCVACHSPHGSDNLFLANEATTPELCGLCHEWQAHSSHPIGEKFVDPRNPNLTVDCLSCHRSHGTEYEHFLYFETINQMCVQCHAELRR